MIKSCDNENRELLKHTLLHYRSGTSEILKRREEAQEHLETAATIREEEGFRQLIQRSVYQTLED